MWIAIAALGFRLRDLLEPTPAPPRGGSSSSFPSHTSSSSSPRMESYAESTAAPRPRGRGRRRRRRDSARNEDSHADCSAAPARRRGRTGKLLGLLPPWQQSMLRPLETAAAAATMQDEELFFDERLLEENKGDDGDYDVHSDNSTPDEGEKEEVVEADAPSELPAGTESIRENEAVIGRTREEDIDGSTVEEKVETATPEAANPSRSCFEDDIETTDVAEATFGDDLVVPSLPWAEESITSQSDVLSDEGMSSNGAMVEDAGFSPDKGPDEVEYAADFHAASAPPADDDIHEAQSLSTKGEEDILKGLETGRETGNGGASGEGDVASSDDDDAVVCSASQENSLPGGDPAPNNARIADGETRKPAVGTKYASVAPSGDDFARAATSHSATAEGELQKETMAKQGGGDRGTRIDDVEATPIEEDGVISSLSKDDSIGKSIVSENVASDVQRVGQNDSAGKTEHAWLAEALDGTRVPTKDEDDVKEIAIMRRSLLQDQTHGTSDASATPENDTAEAPTLSKTVEIGALQNYGDGKASTHDATSTDEEGIVASVSKDDGVEDTTVSKDVPKKIEENEGALNEGTSGSEIDGIASSAAQEISTDKADIVKPDWAVDDQAASLSSPSINKLQGMAAMITIVANLLPVAYSVAVHSFLSFFHERSFGDGRHWRPIAFRVWVAIAICGMRWVALGCCAILNACDNSGDESSSPTIPLLSAVEIIFAAASAVASFALLLETRSEEVDGPAPPSVDMRGKAAFVTGANAGIGLETARRLHERGATVFLGCRSRSRASLATKDIDPSGVEIDASRRLRFVPLNLTSNASVREAAKTFVEMNVPLHVLILNAGVMRKEREETADGLEATMAANHLGHFLLTHLLLPKLWQTALEERHPSRVLTVSSSLYRTASRFANGKLEPGIDLHDLQCERKRYALFEQYAQSKLANVMFALELGRRERERRENREEWVVRESNSNGDEEKTEDDGNGPCSKRELRRRLTPILLPEVDSEEDDGDTGSGSDGIASTPDPPSDEVAHEDDDEGGRMQHGPISETASETDAERDAFHPVLSFCLHPGLVRTDVVRDMPWYLYYPNKMFSVFLAALQKSPRAGASCSVYCATMNPAKMDRNDECYFVNSGSQPLERLALNRDEARRLWELSGKLVSIPSGEKH